MSSHKKYPYFDFLEIVLENEAQQKPYKPLSPVKTGNIVPAFALSKDFGRWRQFVNGAEVPPYIQHRQLAGKPLVIAFYSQHWGQPGNDHLQHLNALQGEIKANGGNLVIVTPQRETNTERLAWEHEFTLNFYTDEGNELARHLRIFDENSPVWNLFSGVDENVPLLATYVIDNHRQIIFDHIDKELSGKLPADEIISAVYHSAEYKSVLKSA